MALITYRTAPADPYYYHIPDTSLILAFHNYGRPVELTDALLAVQTASLQAWSMKPTKLVGTTPRSYKYGTSVLYIEPQAQLNWKTFNSVTFGIITILQRILCRETSFSIMGTDYEGYFGWVSVNNVASKGKDFRDDHK